MNILMSRLLLNITKMMKTGWDFSNQFFSCASKKSVLQCIGMLKIVEYDKVNVWKEVIKNLWKKKM